MVRVRQISEIEEGCQTIVTRTLGHIHFLGGLGNVPGRIFWTVSAISNTRTAVAIGRYGETGPSLTSIMRK